jgi:hypothetical protein
MYILRNWIIIQMTRPDGGVVIRLRGKVYGNPRYESGGEVTVSAIRSCCQEGDSLSVTTRTGSEYVLGKPNRSEPLAKARLLRYFQDEQSAAAAAASREQGRTQRG